eukprot:CAMPEP_0116124946 /NCGR_PEP_ID=MMETSP0329-20121206/5551_1 /TAXON_ID=697910 /ORGANISM="Pseudo-nitzschia arenysensis, Strain B593" /LENGTH=129 /DNA_ID=CAMNT_0003618959 /DNA_START=597 /DNA_END=986 /DNA_ORIENTATION=+
MASGTGSLYLPSLSYKPVPGVRKSGIPAEQLAPAPTTAIILENFESASLLAKDSTENVSVSELEEDDRNRFERVEEWLFVIRFCDIAFLKLGLESKIEVGLQNARGRAVDAVETIGVVVLVALEAETMG